MSAVRAHFEFAKFVEHEPSLAHHTASAAAPVEPMHEEHAARRRAVEFVKRVAPALLEMDVMRVVHVAHAVATAALIDAAMEETADVVSFPPTTAVVGKPVSVSDRLVLGIGVQADAPGAQDVKREHADALVAPENCVVLPLGQAVQLVAAAPEYVPVAHVTHAEPEKYVPAVHAPAVISQKGAPAFEVVPDEHAVHWLAPSFENVPAAHLTHAEPE